MEVNLKKLVLNKQKRRGRGIGTGVGGHTIGYGQKGQGSRGGHKVKATLEGGNIPLYRKLPTQQGFRSLAGKAATVRISWLNAHTVEGQVVDAAFLVSKGVIEKAQDKAKIVGKDKVAHKITIKKLGISSGARQAIETAGGVVID
ncbi:50S ribosomal protein L15 [bacterium]|nr:50S ribosomal protein L15 [bacterium]